MRSDLIYDGELDSAKLSTLCKALNLHPRGRLTDTEDVEFGYRHLQDEPGLIRLTLYRRGDSTWVFNLYSAGPIPHEMVDQVHHEVIPAAALVGLTPTGSGQISPIAAALSGHDIKTADTTALSVRLVADDSGLRDPDVIRSLRSALDLKRDAGGASGRERGWRYLHRDAARTTLLQLLSDRSHSSVPIEDNVVEIVVLTDGTPLEPELAAALRLEITAAAHAAALVPVAFEPPASADQPDLDSRTLQERGAGAPDIWTFWHRLGVLDGGGELRRASVLAYLAPRAHAVLGEGKSDDGLYERLLPYPRSSLDTQMQDVLSHRAPKEPPAGWRPTAARQASWRPRQPGEPIRTWPTVRISAIGALDEDQRDALRATLQLGDIDIPDLAAAPGSIGRARLDNGDHLLVIEVHEIIEEGWFIEALEEEKRADQDDKLMPWLRTRLRRAVLAAGLQIYQVNPPEGPEDLDIAHPTPAPYREFPGPGSELITPRDIGRA